MASSENYSFAAWIHRSSSSPGNGNSGGTGPIAHFLFLHLKSVCVLLLTWFFTHLCFLCVFHLLRWERWLSAKPRPFSSWCNSSMILPFLPTSHAANTHTLYFNTHQKSKTIAEICLSKGIEIIEIMFEGRTQKVLALKSCGDFMFVLDQYHNPKHGLVLF